MRKDAADVLIKSATFFCGKKCNSDIDFIAIKGNKIIGSGTEAQEGNYIDENTVIYEFTKDNLVMPGLHDNHIHLIQSGMLDKYVDLSAASSEEEVADMVLNFSKKIPDEKWVIGFGWSRFAWENKNKPTKASLDAVINDRPILLFDSELHAAWANSVALLEAGVTNATPDPPFGKIDKDEEGNPNGYFYETALTLIARHALNFDDALVKDLIRRYSEKAVRWGITSVSDMTPYLGINLAFEEIFMKMDENKELMIRINAARNLFEDIEEVVKLRDRAEKSGTGMYRIPFLKQFIDGIISNYTALMLEDYSNYEGNRGGTLLDLTELKKAVKNAHTHNLSVRLHACGDGAVNAALNAYEDVIKECGANNCRHQIEHIEVISPNDIHRFENLGVIASVQPEHIISGTPSFSDNEYPQLLGKERERNTWAFKSLKEAGAVLAGGSDSPVVEGSPFAGILCGLERVHSDGTPEGGWNPDEKLDIEDLLEIYTYGAAYAEGRDKELGTLEVNKLADITVVDRNLLKVASNEIINSEILLTMVNGKVVYKNI